MTINKTVNNLKVLQMMKQKQKMGNSNQNIVFSER